MSHSLACAGRLLLLMACCGSPAASVRAAETVNLEDRANRVRLMNVDERARLQKNIAAFEKLPPDQQAAYRQLSHEVESDPSLKQTMDTYAAWLQTLTPGQREELRLEKNTFKRRDLVERFRKEQLARDEMPMPELGPGSRNPWHLAPALPRAELLAALTVLEEAIPEARRAQLPPAKDSVGELERAWDVAVFLGRMDNGDQIPDEIYERMAEVIESPAVRSYVQQKERSRFAWSIVIGKSLFEEIRQQMKNLEPDDAVLREHFSELDSTQRFNQEKLTRDDWRRAVIESYFQKHPDTNFERLSRLRPWWRPGPENRGPGRGGEGRGGDGPPRPVLDRLRGEGGPREGGPPGPRPPGPRPDGPR